MPACWPTARKSIWPATCVWACSNRGQTAQHKEPQHETCGDHRHGHRLVHRQRHGHGHAVAACWPLGHPRHAPVQRVGHAQPGGGRAADQPGSADRPQATALHGRCSGLRAYCAGPRGGRIGPGPRAGVAPAHRPDHGLGRRLAGQPDPGRRHPAHPPHTPPPAIRRVGPYQVTRCMGSTVSACLSTHFGIKGINYSITSACSTSAHCIGAAAQQIAWGMQDVMFAGGGEEVTWGMGLLFDAMGAMSSAYNATPEKASRAYDARRDGFVLSGGGGAVVLESLEHAQARGATILGELIGFGATSDGADMVAPSGDGAVACMRQAIATVQEPIDYINTHGTSTPVGDVPELRAIRTVFGAAIPPFSSTKSLTGHSLGATGVQEAIYCLLMLRQGFIAGSANIETLEPEAEGMPLVRAT